MAKSDEYRAKAEVCRRMAVAAISPQDKATWLKLAAGWLALIHRRNQLAAERLEAMEREPANRQENQSGSPRQGLGPRGGPARVFGGVQSGSQRVKSKL